VVTAPIHPHVRGDNGTVERVGWTNEAVINREIGFPPFRCY
jgi:hypothetical protein